MITLLSTWTFGLALGFVALGDEFEEEGIPHREMILEWDAD